MLNKQVKHQKFLSKYKRLKRKCSNLINAARIGCRSQNHFSRMSSDFSEMVVEHSCYSFASPAKVDGNEKSTTRVIYVKRCPHESAPEGKSRKRKKRKRADLRKRGELSLVGTRASAGEGGKAEEPGTFALGCQVPSGSLRFHEKLSRVLAPTADNAWGASRGCESGHWKVCPLWAACGGGCCAHGPFRGYDCLRLKGCVAAEEPQDKKKRKTFRNPLDVLRRGGKIKIPVLFEELCNGNGGKAKNAGHKASNVSMSFVLVEAGGRNPLNPLRKLIKKLSQTHSTRKTEQYVFGVSKCCCENKMRSLGLITNKNVLAKFGLG